MASAKHKNTIFPWRQFQFKVKLHQIDQNSGSNHNNNHNNKNLTKLYKPKAFNPDVPDVTREGVHKMLQMSVSLFIWSPVCLLVCCFVDTFKKSKRRFTEFVCWIILPDEFSPGPSGIFCFSSLRCVLEIFAFEADNANLLANKICMMYDVWPSWL